MPNYLFTVNAMGPEGEEVTRQYVSANRSGINVLVAAKYDGLHPCELRCLGETDMPLSPFLRLPETMNPDVDLGVVEQDFFRGEITKGRMKIAS